MAIGMTNAGGVTFRATIHVTSATPSTVVTATLGSRVYSATADSNGTCDIAVTRPGTYTVTNSGRADRTIVCADKGAMYNCPFIIYLYKNGAEGVGWTVKNGAVKNTDNIYSSGSSDTTYFTQGAITTDSLYVKTYGGKTWANLVFKYEDCTISNGTGASHQAGCVLTRSPSPFSRDNIANYVVEKQERSGNIAQQDVTFTVSLASLDENTRYYIATYNESYGTNASKSYLKEVYLE